MVRLTEQGIVDKIKEKQELRHISEDFVMHKLAEYRRTHPKVSSLEDVGAKDSALMIKRLRGECRQAFGMFFTRFAKRRDKHLRAYLEDDSEENYVMLLKTHKSSKERVEIYLEIFDELFAITGKPSSILDLGCGMNPLSFDLMGLSKVKYDAWDISLGDLEFISKFFESKKDVDFSFKEMDLLELKSSEIDFPDVDVCFMFKLLDHLDLGKDHKLSEKLITSVNANWVVVSFSAKTLSNKPMNHPQRGWFELMCKRLGYKVECIQKVGEIFYVVKK